MIDTIPCTYLNGTTLFCREKLTLESSTTVPSNSQIPLDPTEYRQSEKPPSLLPPSLEIVRIPP